MFCCFMACYFFNGSSDIFNFSDFFFLQKNTHNICYLFQKWITLWSFKKNIFWIFSQFFFVLSYTVLQFFRLEFFETASTFLLSVYISILEIHFCLILYYYYYIPANLFLVFCSAASALTEIFSIMQLLREIFGFL